MSWCKMSGTVGVCDHSGSRRDVKPMLHVALKNNDEELERKK